MARISSDDWVFAALRALARGGPQAVRVEVLARELGVTKGSYYHHFGNRQDVLDACVRSWEDLATNEVIRQIDSISGPPDERLRRLAQLVFAPHGDNDGIEAALRAWGGVDPSAAEAVERVDERRLSYVEGLLAAAGVPDPRARAELVYRALIGEFAWRRAGGQPLPVSTIDLLCDLVLAR